MNNAATMVVSATRSLRRIDVGAPRIQAEHARQSLESEWMCILVLSEG
ncbi:MAG: hypothetical protein ACPGXX_03710 [Planctomycetaceae bacterium]